jgi:hypothetical protein
VRRGLPENARGTFEPPAFDAKNPVAAALSMNLRHSALAVLVAILWGANFVAIDIGLHANGSEVPPLLFAAMRFVLVIFPWIFVIRKPDVSWRAPHRAAGCRNPG